MNLSPLFTWRSAICDSDLQPTTRHVALVLSLHMNERGGSCFPSQPTLAKETGLTDRAVREHLLILNAKGWIERKKQPGRVDMYEATTPEAGSGVPRQEVPHPRNVVPDTPERGSAEDVKNSSFNKGLCTHKNCKGKSECQYDLSDGVPMPKVAA